MPGKGRTRKRVRPVSLPRQVARKEAALRELPARSVRSGKIRLGTTGRLTPTRAGFKALDSTLLSIQREAKKSTRALWTLDLNIRFRGPDGRFMSRKLTGAGLPRPQDVKRQRGRIEKKRGRAFKSDAEAYRHMVETSVKAAVFRSVDQVKSIDGDTDSLMEQLEGKDYAEVRRAMRDFKKRRSLTFKVTLNRVVTRKAGGRAKTKAKVRGRVRQRGRR